MEGVSRIAFVSLCGGFFGFVGGGFAWFYLSPYIGLILPIKDQTLGAYFLAGTILGVMGGVAFLELMRWLFNRIY